MKRATIYLMLVIGVACLAGSVAAAETPAFLGTSHALGKIYIINQAGTMVWD